MAIGIVLFDPGRGIFRALLGAAHGKPIIVADASEMLEPPQGEGSMKIDDRYAVGLLAENGIAEGAPVQLHLTALRRAAAEAFAS